MADTGIPFSSLPETAEINQNDELLLQQEGRTKRISFEKVRGPIDADAANNIDCEVDENTAELTVTLKNKEGETLDEATVSLPNTSNIDCEVDEDTAELTVALKNKAGEVVTSDTVQLPNTSNIDCEISEDMKLTVSLKNKSGQIVTSDTVQLQSALVPSITQSEYDELPEEEKTNGQIREITDAEGFPVPFAIMNDEMTTSANVLSAQETENRIKENCVPSILDFQNETITDYPHHTHDVEYQATEDCFITLTQTWSGSNTFGGNVSVYLDSNRTKLIRRTIYHGYGFGENQPTISSDPLFLRNGEKVYLNFSGYNNESWYPKLHVFTK